MKKDSTDHFSLIIRGLIVSCREGPKNLHHNLLCDWEKRNYSGRPALEGIVNIKILNQPEA